MNIPTILFVGDSITDGRVGSADKTGFRGPFSLMMPGIAHVGPFVDPKGHHHGGVGGATTDTLLNSTTFVKSSSPLKIGSVKVAPTWMDIYKPTYLHLMIGTNNIIKAEETDEAKIAALVKKIADDDATMVALAHKSSPNTMIMLASIPTVGPSWFTMGALALNAELQKRAATGQFGPNVRFVDTSAKINKAFAGVASSVSVDGTHPNDKGYGLLAEGVADAVRATPAPSVGTGGSASSSGVERAVLYAGGAYVAYRVWRWWSS